MTLVQSINTISLWHLYLVICLLINTGYFITFYNELKSELDETLDFIDIIIFITIYTIACIISVIIVPVLIGMKLLEDTNYNNHEKEF